jgi:hypothetical protein
MAEFPQKRLLPAGAAACLVLAVMGAEIFVFTCLEHNHDGPDCSACLGIEITRHALEGLAAAPAAVSLPGLAKDTDPASAEARRYFVSPVSPIALHIKSTT